jgi:hypothetical protein
MTDPRDDADDPDHVRVRLRDTLLGDWHVFETIAADGSLAIGIGHGQPNPSAVMVVYEGLTREIAGEAAAGLVRWHRSRGRHVAGS